MFMNSASDDIGKLYSTVYCTVLSASDGGGGGGWGQCKQFSRHKSFSLAYLS
jgi:hypothetical protein